MNTWSIQPTTQNISLYVTVVYYQAKGDFRLNYLTLMTLNIGTFHPVWKWVAWEPAHIAAALTTAAKTEKLPTAVR